ncbi:MAG: hypothetical protein ACYC1E_15540 [Propionibacteriaceae bacterium]
MSPDSSPEGDFAVNVTYQISADPGDLQNSVIVTNSDGREWRIHREDADPEHRFTAYRLAAGWFGNLPAGYTAD